MSRIGALLSGAERLLLGKLALANAAAAQSTLQLATGHQINAPRDDPSGFVALSNLQSDLGNVTTTLSNVTAAAHIVSGAQLTIDQIRTQLNNIRTAAVADQGQALTPDQRVANQASIDTAIQTINQLASTTIGGRRVLDGSADFQYAGVNGNQVANIQAYDLGAASAQTVSGTVTSAATQAQLTYTGAAGATTSAATFSLAGDRGSATFTIGSGAALTDVRDQVNQSSDLTGVTAAASGNNLTLTSIAYGKAAKIAVSVSSGTFAVTGGHGDGTANGTDATATINGQAIVGQGNRFDLNASGLRATIEFAGGFSGAFDPITVSGSALKFALSTDLTQRSTLAIPGLQAARLGGPSGTLDQLATGGAKAGLGANAAMAVRIVDEALGKLKRVSGGVDGFANAAISSSSNLLKGLQTNIKSSIDSIDKVDDAAESALLAQNQALALNALAGLSILNNQRQDIVKLIQGIAGLN